MERRRRLRTILYHFILAGTFIYGLFFRYPYLLFVKGEKAYRFVCKVGKNWGKNLVWASGSKVKVIYKNNCEEEIKKIKETKEAVILISNHQSNVDIPVLLGYLPLDFSFVAKKEMKKWPLIGRWMRRFDCIFLDRTNPRQGMKDMKEAIAKVRNGHSYVIFPEGSRSEDGEVGEFKKGSFKLALEPKVKILPVTIDGTFFIMNKNNFFVNRGKTVKLKISKTINLKEIERYRHVNINDFVKKIISENLKSV